ncbi:NAD(P)/FAD-dependent oxidoreductase [Thalassospira sp. HF15]|uniref:NAD(P)-binding protein n=1 Tax=Thalassospira sp. HF15 TaxID=2722755 RepID=UPI001431CBD4|nr:FAD/NAD(P)-binding protein [Thalassospira sp. HF15]NIY74404.1 NAD(P)/FAD-dependent oxidoreductase [Thalassospira sp. HF15]
MASFASGSLHVIGGGLAGSALATSMAEDGFTVTLYDAAEPFESRWTRGMHTAPESYKTAEPEIFYDPMKLVADFFAGYPEVPNKLIRPAHCVMGLKRGRRKPAIVSLDPGISRALISRRVGVVARAYTALILWQQRYASEENRLESTLSPGTFEADEKAYQSGTYHRDALTVLAEVLFSMPAHRCSKALLGRVLVPRLRQIMARHPEPVFSAIDPIILNDIALPTLRERFLAAGGVIKGQTKLGDIDSTSDYATDLLFEDDSQVVLKPDDAVVLAMHPKPLCDAVPDIGISPAPAHRRCMAFEMRKPFAEPRALFVSDDIVRAIYCNRRHLQVSLNNSLQLQDADSADQFAALVWQRCVWLCDQYLNLDLQPRAVNAENASHPNHLFIDAEAPFPEMTPGMAATCQQLRAPWKNVFLCGDLFARDQPPGPAALFSSLQDTRHALQEFFA